MGKAKTCINTELTVWLLTLTLFFGFPPTTSTGQHQATKSVTTESVIISQRPARRTFIYRVVHAVRGATNVIPDYFLKIVNVLMFFARQIITGTADNFRRTYSVQYIQSRHIDFTLCAADLAVSTLRG